MVQVTFDTNADSIEELENALRILQQALERRKATPPPVDEETAIDTPFLKVTVRNELDAPEPKMPTLNQLLTDDSITEEELTRLFKEQQLQEQAKGTPRKEQKKDTAEDAYIEIVEYND